MPKYKKTSSPAVNVTQNANLAPAVNVTHLISRYGAYWACEQPEQIQPQHTTQILSEEYQAQKIYTQYFCNRSTGLLLHFQLQKS